VRLYERLFNKPNPLAEDNYLDAITAGSLTVMDNARVEIEAVAEIGTRFQFERQGYFAVDNDSTIEQPVYNRIVSLRDTFQ